MNHITISSDKKLYNNVLHFLYKKYPIEFNDLEYLSEKSIKPLEYGFRRKKDEFNIKVLVPLDICKELIYNEEKIIVNVETLKDKSGKISKILQTTGCNSMEEIIYKLLRLSSDKKETLLKLIDDSNIFCKEEVEKSKKNINKSINVYIWRKDYWSMLFKSPKRPIETLYLKKGVKEDIIDKIEDFFSEKTRQEYLSNGIPYKNVFLLYGVPGSGKTSTINTIASHFNSGIYVIPISKELTDYGLIDAMGFIDEQEEDHRIIVIEDIDSIFTDRKKGDDNNGITLQGLLNCFDGLSICSIF